MSQAEVFNDSFERVLVNNRDFYKKFYQIFLNSSEDISKMFSNTDMIKQERMLKLSFTYVLSFSHKKRPSQYLIDLSDTHQHKLKITDAMYDIWLDSLMKTVQVFDNKFSDKIDTAWRSQFMPGLNFMKGK